MREVIINVPECPICKNDLCCRFVFAEEIIGTLTSKHNPTDFHTIFLCPKLHLFDERGQIIKPLVK